METFIDLRCETCGIIFKRRLAEVNRNRKIGRRIFCSLRCENMTIHNIPDNIDRYPIKDHAGNKKDAYSNYRYIWRIARNRARSTNREFTITLDDLKDLAEKQKFKCVYSGVPLVFNNGTKSKSDPMHTASLDRIDSSKGYTKDNIQFVSCTANYAKNSITHDQMVEFCRNIVKLWENTK